MYGVESSQYRIWQPSGRLEHGVVTAISRTSASTRSVRGSIVSATSRVLRRASTASSLLDTVTRLPMNPDNATDSASSHTVLRKAEVSM